MTPAGDGASAAHNRSTIDAAARNKPSMTAVVARNSLWTVVDTVTTLLSSIASTMLVARALGAEKTGHYGYMLFIATITQSLAGLGVPSATRKYAGEYVGKGELATARTIVEQTFRFQAAVALVVVAAGLAIVALTVTPEHRLFTALAVLCILPGMLLAVPTAANCAVEDVSANVIPSVISAVIMSSGSAVCVALGGDLVELVSVILFARVVDFLVRYHFFRRRFSQFPVSAEALPRDLHRRMLRFCWQSTGLLLLNLVVWSRSEVFFLKRYSDMTQIAFYSLGFNVMQQLMAIPRIFSQAVGVTMIVQHARDPESMGRVAATAFRYLALVALPICFGMAALSGPVIYIFYGPKFAGAAPSLTVVALFSAAAVLRIPSEQALIAADKQAALVRCTLFAAVLNVLLDYLWTKDGGGAVGAAAANGVTQLVAAVAVISACVRMPGYFVPLAGLLRVVAAAASMALPVAMATRWLSPILGAAMGVPMGIVLFVVVVRQFRVFEPDDFPRFLRLQKQLPGRLRGHYDRGLKWLTV